MEKSDRTAAEIYAWCTSMLQSDRVRFIARERLESLRKRFPANAAQ